MTSRALTIPQIPQAVPPSPPLLYDIRGTTLIGLVILLVFFVIGGVWAATSRLSGAAIASGMVSPEGQRQTVQHLEGGIIREILVRGGDVVAAGQPLYVLEDIIAQAEVGTLRTRLRTLAATEARLRAERVGAAEIVFDHPSLADETDPEVQAVILQQVNQLNTRRANTESREAILQQRIAQLDQQILGAERQLAGARRQNELIREEIATVVDLVRQGYERKPRLLALQRAEAELMGTEGELISRIARSEEAIGETKLQIINLTTDRVEAIDGQLADVQAQRTEVEQRIHESLDRLSRTTIVAPVAGTVLNPRFKTPGGVIRPGEPVLEIVPSNDELIIDVRLPPQEIDQVHRGLEAHVTFPSYPQRTVMRIPGEVFYVAADVLEDERTGMPYFTAKVRVDGDVLRERAPDIELTPGLPAEVYITTTERSMLDYLLQPLLQSLERSFRES